jgi:hypothetical protein
MKHMLFVAPLLAGCGHQVKAPVLGQAIVAPQWSERSGALPTSNPDARFPQRGEWRCPYLFRLVDDRTGKHPGLGREWDGSTSSGLVCR